MRSNRRAITAWAFAAMVLFVGEVSAQAPSNDFCVTAIAIGDGLFVGTNINATTGPDPVGSCGAMGTDVWYAYTASCTGIAVASFCPPGSATYDTVLTAWSGTCGSLVEIICNDDSCGTLQSTVAFAVTAGTIYYISAGGFSDDVGNFVLSLSCTAGGTSNDSCSNAVVLSLGVPVAGSNVSASTGGDPVVTLCGSANAFDVWYVVVPPCSGTYSATTCQPGTNFDTVLGVWSGGCGSLSPVACNDDDPTGCIMGAAFGLESTLSWTATAGTPYYISVAGFGGNQGNFSLLVQTGSGLSLTFINSGPGTIGYQVIGGPPSGFGFTVATINAGAFPNDWFFGIAASFQEIMSQFYAGFPFFVGLDPCGSVTVGPFGGLPSGVTVYGVTLVGAGSLVPTGISPPASGTIP